MNCSDCVHAIYSLDGAWFVNVDCDIDNHRVPHIDLFDGGCEHYARKEARHDSEGIPVADPSG